MLTEELKKIISSTKLPGEVAHQKMAPTNRPLSSFAKKDATSFRESSVAVLLVKGVNSLEIILIQRPEYEGNHSGQVSFPGGKREISDSSLFETAVRECFEEIGVSVDEANFIAQLTPIFIPVSSFHVEAFLFYLNEKPTYLKDRREVEEIFTIQLNELLDDNFVKEKSITINENFVLNNVPYFSLENKVIWGATALILSEVKELFKGIKI